MKKILLPTFAMILSWQNSFSQETDHVNGGSFLKQVEYNASSGIIMVDEHGNETPSINWHGKSPLEKIFFGSTNSPVEFVIETSFEGSAGLRLYREKPGGDGSDWLLEVIPFGDYEMVVRAVNRETEKIAIPLWFLGRLQQNYHEQVREFNEQASLAAAKEETYKPHRPETKTFPLHHLGNKLYEKTVAMIDRFKAKGGSVLIADGYTATFRCVVGDELWSLTIHEPQKRALQMSDFYRQIIEDAQSSTFDELKYERMLEQIEF